MSEKIIGTVVLDGMIEGQLPDTPNPQQRIKEWIVLAKSNNLRFTLEVDGNRFSLLADSRPISTDALRPDPTQTIAETITALLQAFEAQTMPFSTLRSAEYISNEEIQSVYLITPNGKVQTEQRRDESQTIEPVAPLTLKEKIKQAAIGIAIAAVLFGLSSIWIPYGQLFDNLRQSAFPGSVEKLQIYNSLYQPYFTITDKQIKQPKGSRVLILTLKRTPQFPATEENFQKLLEAQPTIANRLKLDALARGYLICELFDKKGQFLGKCEIRIRDFALSQEIQVLIPLPTHTQTITISF